MTNSKFRIGFFVTILAAVFLCLPGLMAGKGGGSSSSKPSVTATISSTNANMPADVTSDGGGSYTSLGEDEVFASTTPPELNGWDLNLSDSTLTGREVCVTINNSSFTFLSGCYSGGIVSSGCFGCRAILEHWRRKRKPSDRLFSEGLVHPRRSGLFVCDVTRVFGHGGGHGGLQQSSRFAVHVLDDNGERDGGANRELLVP